MILVICLLFADVKFLNFFYNRMKLNENGTYEEYFPYVSPCGREQNYIRVDDLPVVYTKILGEDCDTELVINGSDMRFPFDPSQIHMDQNNGRIYHTGPDKLHGVGLLSSKLAIQLSSRFEMVDGVCQYFKWKGTSVRLTGDVEERLGAIKVRRQEAISKAF